MASGRPYGEYKRDGTGQPPDLHRQPGSELLSQLNCGPLEADSSLPGPRSVADLRTEGGVGQGHQEFWHKDQGTRCPQRCSRSKDDRSLFNRSQEKQIAPAKEKCLYPVWSVRNQFSL